MTKVLIRFFPLVCVLACSSAERVPAEPASSPRAHAVVAELARFRGILERPRGWTTAVPLGVTTKTTADAPTRIASGDAWLSIAALDVSSARAARVDGGRFVFADASPATDIIEIVERARVEEVRILRDPTARPTARYRVEHSATIAGLRARSGVIEAVDHEGVARFATEPAFAIDANGTRRSVALTVNGNVIEARLDAAGLSYPIAVDPAWTALAAPPTQHSWPVIGRLANGKILHVGGYTHEKVSLFDPTTKTWSVAAPMSTKRGAPVGWVVGNTAIAIAGSSVTTSTVSTSEIYDAATDTWTPGPSLPEGRRNAKGVDLGDGRYMITGGSTGTSASLLSTAWLWTPSATSFTSAGSHRPRGWHFAVKLNDGRVLAGSGANTPTVDVWTSPSTWTPAASMPMERQSPAAVVLPSGKVLVNGGTKTASSPLVIHSSSEIYDPATDTWTPTAPSLKGHWSHTLYLLPTGKVLLLDTDAEIFDPDTSTWMPAGTAMIDGQGVMLPSGELYVQGLSIAKLFVQGNNGDACAADYECKSLFCVDGVCCDKRCGEQCSACDVAGSVGTCTAVTGAPHGTRPSCGAFVCNAGACDTTCTSDSQCASTHYCASGTCVAKKANAGTCTANNQCTNGFCVDGVCCESACSGQCEACDVTPGVCSAVTGAPRGTRAACGGAGAGTECGAVCNGTTRTACAFPSAKPCSSNSCTGGVETHASICDGAGSCGDVPKSCGPYRCGTTACLSACTGAADCATGFSCISNVCTAGPAPKLGDACTDASTCPTGASCVDGVCCDRACDGQCEACDVSGSVGTCKTIAGAPHGKRAACATDTSDVCKSRTCNGVEPSSCAGYVSGNKCGDATCNAALFRSDSTCDGSGACKAGPDTACAPFGCDSKGCLTTCVENTHCAKGFVCEGKTCIPAPTATCEGNTSVSPSGTRQDCAPYRCRTDGLCGSTCGSTDDCAPGAVCDPGAKTCTVASAPTEDGGGCSTGRSRGNAVGALLVALGLALTLRRRAS